MAASPEVARANGKKGGRPFGSKNVITRKRVRDYFTEDQIAELMEMAYTRSKESDKILAHLIDHIYGKAPQAITGADGTALIISFEKTFDAQN